MRVRTILALLLLPALAWADDIQICERSYNPQHAWSWETLKTRLVPALEAGKHESSISELLNMLKGSPNQKDQKARQLMETRIAEVLQKKRKCCSDFQVAYLPGENAWDAGRAVLFPGADEIDLSLCAEGRADQNDELRYLANALVNIGNHMHQPARVRSVKAMEELSVRYDRMLFEGFPMMPWEAAANSWFLAPKTISQGPPHHQLVLLHPSLGTSMSTARFSQIRFGAGLAVEPLGWVYYPRSAEHRSWWGVSTVALFRGDLGLGAGVLARYRHFSAGVVWHDLNNDNRLFNDRGFIYLGMDLYQLLGRTARGYHAYKEKVGQTLSATMQGASEP